MIKTIIFDLGAVLIHIDPIKSINTLAERVHIPPQKMLDLLYNSKYYREYERGLIDDRAFYRGILNEVKGDYDFKTFKDLWNNIFTPNKPMFELLPKLEKQYQLVMISNTNKMHIDYIRQHIPLFDHFNHLFFSYEVGFAKPDHKIFKFALKESGSTPQQCFYIDDMYDHVRAASDLGIHAYVFTTYERLMNALHTFEILRVK